MKFKNSIINYLPIKDQSKSQNATGT